MPERVLVAEGWSLEAEIILFDAIRKYPPVGKQQDINMLNLYHALKSAGLEKAISFEQVRDRLEQMYALEHSTFRAQDRMKLPEVDLDEAEEIEWLRTQVPKENHLPPKKVVLAEKDKRSKSDATSKSESGANPTSTSAAPAAPATATATTADAPATTAIAASTSSAPATSATAAAATATSTSTSTSTAAASKGGTARGRSRSATAEKRKKNDGGPAQKRKKK